MSDEDKLQNAVNSLLASYKDHPELERIGKKALPTKEEIINLTKDIQMLIFPGFIRQEPLDTLDIAYVIGQKTAQVLKQLQTYMEQVLCWEIAKDGLSCEDDPSFSKQVNRIAMEFIETIPQVRNIMAKDVDEFYRGDPAARSKQEIIIGYPGINALCTHRIAHFFYQKEIPLLPRIMSEYVHSQTGIDIHPGATLGEGIMIDHGTGIVIGETSIIGGHVRIYQGVTIGALSPTRKVNSPKEKRHPTIENDVVIYAGATILGGKTVVGKNSIIGGNVWLTHSIPPYSRVIWEAKTQKNSIKKEEIMLCPEE